MKFALSPIKRDLPVGGLCLSVILAVIVLALPVALLSWARAEILTDSRHGTITHGIAEGASAYGFTAEQRAAFERATIGERVSFTVAAGDGCNTCLETYEKVSETTVRGLGSYACTVKSCLVMPPAMRFK